MAQFPKAGDNIKDGNLDKFIGTWIWHNDSDSLILTFKKENIYMDRADIHMDVLIGFHKFVKNNVVIENSTEHISSWYNDGYSTLFGGTDRISINKLDVYIKHTSKNKSVNAVIQYIESNQIKIVSIVNPEGVFITSHGEAPRDFSISLPSNIVLIKQ